MGDKKYNIEDSVISSRIALSLTDGNSYILVNNAEEYYRQLTDALVDIKNDVSSSYVYFAFISLAFTCSGPIIFIICWYLSFSFCKWINTIYSIINLIL